PHPHSCLRPPDWDLQTGPLSQVYGALSNVRQVVTLGAQRKLAWRGNCYGCGWRPNFVRVPLEVPILCAGQIHGTRRRPRRYECRQRVTAALLLLHRTRPRASTKEPQAPTAQEARTRSMAAGDETTNPRTQAGMSFEPASAGRRQAYTPLR